jgi:hypothetical protein
MKVDDVPDESEEEPKPPVRLSFKTNDRGSYLKHDEYENTSNDYRTKAG